MYKKPLIILLSLTLLSCNKTEPLSQTASLFNTLTTSDDWQLVSTIDLQTTTYHPQGLKKIGDYYYLSTVEIIEPTTRFAKLENGYDRSTGKGQGYLQKFDSNGKLITSIQLGEKDIYHPGGIDYDGKFIYVPVAEYRPNSASIIYKVDPNTMQSSELFRTADHIGGVVYNKDSNKIHAVSWGSRRFYEFKSSEKNDATNPTVSENKSYYIDYQDAKYVGGNTAIFSGIKEFKFKGQDIAIGGLELRSLDTHHTIIKQIPIKMLSKLNKLMTGNTFDIELTDDNKGLLFYFAPDDDTTTIYIYKANIKI